MTDPESLQADGNRRYDLLLELGTGGMGKVYLARMLGLGGFERIVALKRLHPHLKADAEFVAMFLDEARIAARIHHPNVVPTLEVGESDVLYLVMEYVEGETLSTLLKAAIAARVPIPVPVALRVVADALQGLYAAHTLADARGQPLGVVHRDVTPQNIIVGVDGVTRILDFGIATAALRSSTTKEGQIKGKFGYMPPEYLDGSPASPGTDVYGAGVVLWEVLAGEHLFKGKSELDIAAAVLRGIVPRLTERRHDVPPALDAVLARALAREPSQRFGSAAEFLGAMETAALPMASPRAVAEWVTSLRGDALASRRAALAEARDTTASAGVALSVSGRTPAAAGAPATTQPTSTAEPSPRRRAMLLWTGVVTLVAIAGATWMLGPWAGDGAPQAPAPTLPATTPRDGDPAPRQMRPDTDHPLAVNDGGEPTAAPRADASAPRDQAADAAVAEDHRPAPTERRPRRGRPRRRAKAAPGEWWPEAP